MEGHQHIRKGGCGMERSSLTTLCYIEKDNCYLMMHKWIGVGGHFEPDESPEECLLREVKEETGLTLTSYRFRGLVTFLSDRWNTEYMCLYTADGYEGELTADCREGTLEWVDKRRLRELNLWEGDYIFLDLLEKGADFFSLKLRYEGDVLKEVCLHPAQPI